MNKSPVPEFIFSKDWADGNFLVPSSKELRVELRLQLIEFSGYCIMWLTENKKLRNLLVRRIHALEAYD